MSHLLYMPLALTYSIGDRGGAKIIRSYLVVKDIVITIAGWIPITMVTSIHPPLSC